MKPSELGGVVQKYKSLRAMAKAGLDEARRALLTNIIETYLPLNEDEQNALRRLIAAPEGKEICDMISVYEQRGIEQGIERGIEQGIERGIEQGIEQGVVRGKREALLRLMHHRFGELPEEVIRRIELLMNSDELDRLFDRAVDSASLESVGLSGV